MANISYCKFQNTFQDLEDCFEKLKEKSLYELSESEKEYAIKLIEMCKEIADDLYS